MKYIIAITSFLIIYSCLDSNVIEKNQLSQAIPVNSDIIIKIYDINKISKKINKIKWWQDLKNTNSINDNINNLVSLNKICEFTTLLNSRTIFISSVLAGQNKYEFLYITSINDIEKQFNDIFKNIEKKQKKYENTIINILSIKNIENENIDFFYSTHNGILMASFSEITMQKSILQIQSNQNIFSVSPIKDIEKNLPKYSDLNILVKTNFIEKLIGKKNIFLNTQTWSSFDVELEKDILLLNGVTNRGDIQYLKDAKYSAANISKIEQILPRHITGFYKYHINNAIDLNSVINNISNNFPHKYYIYNNDWKPQEINVAFTDEIFNKVAYLIFNADNNKICQSQLITDTKFDYLSFEIYNNKALNINWINELTHSWNDFYFIIYEGYIVSSSSIKEIKSLINNIKSKQTIDQNKALRMMNTKLGDKSHTAFYLNFQNKSNSWKDIFNSVVSKNIASKDYFFNSLIFLHKDRSYTNPTNWNFFIDYKTSYKPQIVKNHISGKNEILTQDLENIIYLINFEGKLIWKQKIGGQIIGEIHQIDSYNNNKLQYLFNTQDSIYLMDRNGKYVDPFPLASEYSMSIPLALFDYDKNKNYRILIPMGGKLKMIDKRGNNINGWELTSVKSNINTTPLHFQLFNKDYIAISEDNGSMHLVNRKGQDRANIKEKLYLGENPINIIKGSEINNSKLITLNKKGTLLYIKLNGKLDTLKIQNLADNDTYITDKNCTVILKKNNLIIINDSNQSEHKFKTPPLSKPRIIYLDEKNYIIAIHHKNEQLVYLFNKNGEIIQQPFFGTTEFSISDAQKDSTYNLIIGSEEGVIYNYNFN